MGAIPAGIVAPVALRGAYMAKKLHRVSETNVKRTS